MIYCIQAPCNDLPPVLPSSAIPVRDLMLSPFNPSLQPSVIDTEPAIFHAETVSLDWYRVVFMVIGIAIGIAVLKK